MKFQIQIQIQILIFIYSKLFAEPLKSVINENLNKEQKNAVGAALDDKFPLVAICGPPGTGKTHVVEEIIQQAIKLGKRVSFVRFLLFLIYNG